MNKGIALLFRGDELPSVWDLSQYDNPGMIEEEPGGFGGEECRMRQLRSSKGRDYFKPGSAGKQGVIEGDFRFKHIRMRQIPRPFGAGSDDPGSIPGLLIKGC
jgi:hypothetical protein